MLPRLRAISPKLERDTLYFLGINKRDNISDEELSASKNITHDSFPSLEVRKKIETLGTYSNAQSFFAGTKRCMVAGTNFYYDGVIKGQVTQGHKSMCDFNGKVLIFPDKKYYDYENAEFGNLWTGETEPVYPAVGSVPDLDFVAVHMNRVFGVKGSNIYACASGDAKNWVDYSGDQLDSWATDVSSEGAFTGIIAYDSRLILVKDDFTYELLGSYPAQFQVYETAKEGVIDGRSLVEISGVLYGLTRDGVKIYRGGQWEDISWVLNENYTGGAAGTNGTKYYISLNTGDEGYKLYVYDTQKKSWLYQDAVQVIDFAKYNGVLFALLSTGALVSFDTGTSETINWEIVTKRFTEAVFEKKYYSRVLVRMDVAEGSTVKAHVKFNGGNWQEVATISPCSFSPTTIYIPLSRCDDFQIKISGTGYAKIYSMQREFFIGSDE